MSLPDLQFFDIDAKIDTGAFSCSIHCDDIRLSKDHSKVYFRLLDDSHPDYHDKEIVMDVHKITHVKSSNGTREERIFIMTDLELYGKVFKTEVSLTNRTAMTYPMLIGRKYLEDRFIVDVSLLYQAPKK